METRIMGKPKGYVVTIERENDTYMFYADDWIVEDNTIWLYDEHNLCIGCVKDFVMYFVEDMDEE